MTPPEGTRKSSLISHLLISLSLFLHPSLILQAFQPLATVSLSSLFLLFISLYSSLY